MRFYKIFSLYNTALVSFLLSMTRDYLIINNTDQSLDFFKILYICSIASVLPINYISYNREPPERNSLLIVCILSILILFYLFEDNFHFYIEYFYYGLAIFFLWIIGSIYSQILFINGFIFISKSRESFASFLTVLFILILNFNLIPIFLISVFISLLLLIYLFHNKKLNFKLNTKNKNIINLKEIFKIFISNLSVVAMLIWALKFSSSNIIYGYPAEYVVRVSMYFFQALVIGSSLIIVMENKKILNYPNTFFVSAIILAVGFFISIVSLHVGVILMPIICICIHYLNIHSINSK